MKVAIVTFIVASAVLGKGIDAMVDDYGDYVAQNECVAELIELGVPRSNIMTHSGTCYATG